MDLYRTNSEPTKSELLAQEISLLIPTNIRYISNDMMFYGDYISTREKLDYTYHKNYCESRQHVQDNIVYNFLEDKHIIKDDKPWIIYMAGLMGAGKGITLKWLIDCDKLPPNIKNAIRIDPDDLRMYLPEHSLLQTNKYTKDVYSSITHKEVCYISEIIKYEALKRNASIIIDGTCKDHNYIKHTFDEIRNIYSNYKIAIINVITQEHIAIERSLLRGSSTSRTVPIETIKKASLLIPISIEKLRPYVDFIVSFNNDECQPTLLDVSWDTLYQVWNL